MGFFLVCVATLLCASHAAAAQLPFEGRLRIDFTYLPDSAFVEVARTGIATVNGSGGFGPLASFTLPAGVFDEPGIVAPVTDPLVHPVKGVGFSGGNGAGAFGAGGGVMPLGGLAWQCLFAPCGAAIANLTVPLDVVGAGGTATWVGAAQVTVRGAPWTTATASIGVLTRMGFASGPASHPSSTARPGGRVQLVTPIYIRSNLGPSVAIPAFATLTLHFVPEPASLALVALGATALSIGARRRHH